MSLGKGLNALITSTNSRKKTVFNTGDPREPQRVWSVPISEIKPNPNQPRKNFSSEELKELAQSIKEHGVLQPLLVAELVDGGYELIAGERRLRASQIAGLSVVPVIVKELADIQKLEVSLIENIQREDLNAIEEAFAFKRLIEEFGLTQQQVAEKVGKSRPAIANSVRLLELPEKAREALVERKISAGQARALLSLSEEKQQLDMLTSMLGEHISVRAIEEQVREKKGLSTLRDPNLTYLEEKLRQKLGTKVSIKPQGKGGLIAISYYNKDELEEVVRKLTN